MHDSVADVLEQRGHLDRRSPVGLVASVVLHTLLFGAILVAAHREATYPAPQFVSIRLAPMGRRATPAGRKIAAPQVKPAMPAPAPQPVGKETKSLDKPTERTLFGKSTQQVRPEATLPRGAKPTPARPSSPAASDEGGSGSGQFAVPGIGAAGVTGLEGGDFPYSIYINRMVSLIGTHWFRPEMRGELLAVVNFTIDRDGSVRDAKIEKSSGNSTYDRAALRAVIESSPLPPLPFGYNGTFLGVHLTFH